MKKKTFNESKHTNITLKQVITANMDKLHVVRKKASAKGYVPRHADV